MQSEFTAEFQKRFWSYVDTFGDCWEWQGTRTRQNYGRIMLNKHHLVSHRVAYQLAIAPIPDGLIVRHLCNNPPCCNPAHLAVGTQFDNMHDRIDFGAGYATGENHPLRLHPERAARGAKNGSYTHPERRPYGDANGSRLHPERVPRGDKHYRRTNPEKVPRGERIPWAKLTEAKVREIRQRHAAGGISQSALAREYGVDQTTVSDVVRRKIWRHVT